MRQLPSNADSSGEEESAATTRPRREVEKAVLGNCDHCGGSANSLLGDEHIWKCSEVVPVEDLEDFIKCLRSPWVSRTEDEYQIRQQVADELEEVLQP